MGKDEIKEDLHKYFRDGWRVYKAREIGGKECISGYIVSPKKFIFPDRLLDTCICSICDDAEFEDCLGLHSKEDLIEEDMARQFYQLIEEARRHFDVFSYAKKFQQI